MSRRQQTEETEDDAVDRLAAIAQELGLSIPAQLPFDAGLVERFHQIDFDEPHQHDAFLDQGQLIGGAHLRLPAVMPEVRRDLSADQPHEQGEQQQGNRKPKIEHEGEREQQAKLDRFAEIDSQPLIEPVMHAFQMARRSADCFAGAQGTEGECSQPIGVVIDRAPQPRHRFEHGKRGEIAGQKHQHEAQHREAERQGEQADQVGVVALLPHPREEAGDGAEQAPLDGVARADNEAEQAAVFDAAIFAGALQLLAEHIGRVGADGRAQPDEQVGPPQERRLARPPLVNGGAACPTAYLRPVDSKRLQLVEKFVGVGLTLIFILGKRESWHESGPFDAFARAGGSSGFRRDPPSIR